MEILFIHVAMLILISFLVGLLTLLVGTHIYEKSDLDLNLADGLYIPTIYAKDENGNIIPATFIANEFPWGKNGNTLCFSGNFLFNPATGTTQTPMTEYFVTYPLPVAEGFQTWVNGNMVMFDADSQPISFTNIEIEGVNSTTFVIRTSLVPPSQFYSSSYNMFIHLSYRTGGTNIPGPFI